MALAIFDLSGFKTYLILERGLSSHTVSAYLNDVGKLFNFLAGEKNDFHVTDISYNGLKAFVTALTDLGLEASTQARIISGIKSYFSYLVQGGHLQEDPSALLEMPKLSRKLPDTLHLHEIDQLIEAVDLSKPPGLRNRAILELLYGCGLRVSELCDLKISNIFDDAGFLKVTGKGNKERLVPIGSSALKHLNIYLDERKKMVAEKGAGDLIFLNRFNKRLSRITVFTAIKDLALKAGIEKTISPHTFRHSFA
ncbi:MAG: tyrosine recombinase XerD, partial [Sphingobacteriales bacterium]